MSTLAQYEKLIETHVIQSTETTPELYRFSCTKRPVPVMDASFQPKIDDLKAQLRRIVGDFADSHNFLVQMHDYAVIDESIDEAFYHKVGERCE